jgi:hypothetical protein
VTAKTEYVELPRPARLLRTAGWSLAESFGLPTGGYVLAAWLAGRDAGLWTMLGVIWLTAGIRLLLTRSLPTLIVISLIALTIQAVATIATGNLLIFLAHFPLADLGLCLLFARTARQPTPLAARLAAEMIGLRCPAVDQSRLHRLFQQVTVLWAGVFPLLAATLGALLAIIPLTTYVAVWAITTITLIAAGIVASAMWLRSALHKLGIRFRFAPVTTV